MNSVHTLTLYFPKIHSNVILPPTPRSSEKSGFPTKIYAFLISPVRATCPTHHIKQSSPASHQFLHLISIYSLQHPILKPSQYMFQPYQVSQPYKAMGKIIVLYILIFKFLGMRRVNKTEQNSIKHSPNLIYS
jgi:hypothetical protein